MPAKKSSRPESLPIPTDAAVSQRIVDAARKHFLSHGFRAVTMDDLAKELGMSKKTFYAFFSSKTALVQAVMEQKVESVDADLGSIVSRKHVSFLQALESMLICVQRHTEEVRPSFIRDIRREAPELFEIFAKRRAVMMETHFGRLLRDGRRAGMIRHDIPVKMIIEVLLGATAAIMNPIKMEELGITPKTGFSAILRLVLEGALTDKARPKS